MWMRSVVKQVIIYVCSAAARKKAKKPSDLLMKPVDLNRSVSGTILLCLLRCMQVREIIYTRHLKPAEVTAHCSLSKINWEKQHMMLHCHLQPPFAYFHILYYHFHFFTTETFAELCACAHHCVSELDILCYIDYVFVIMYCVEAVSLVPR